MAVYRGRFAERLQMVNNGQPQASNAYSSPTCSQVKARRDEMSAYKAVLRVQSGTERKRRQKQVQQLAKQEQAHQDDFLQEQDADEAPDAEGKVPRRLLRAERVLANRTERFVLVLECAHDARNEQAVLRTAEALGLQHVWIVVSPMEKNHGVAKSVVRGSTLWLTIRYTALGVGRYANCVLTRIPVSISCLGTSMTRHPVSVRYGRTNSQSGPQTCTPKPR